MKKKTNKVDKCLMTSACCAPPPWQVKSKELAWRRGFSSGRNEGVEDTRKDLEVERKNLENRERELRIEALRIITQSGAQITECMARAYMAFEKVL